MTFKIIVAGRVAALPLTQDQFKVENSQNTSGWKFPRLEDISQWKSCGKTVLLYLQLSLLLQKAEVNAPCWPLGGGGMRIVSNIYPAAGQKSLPLRKKKKKTKNPNLSVKTAQYLFCLRLWRLGNEPKRDWNWSTPHISIFIYLYLFGVRVEVDGRGASGEPPCFSQRRAV